MGPSVAIAQSAGPTPVSRSGTSRQAAPPADKAVVDRLVDATVDAIGRVYLFPEKRPQIIAKLRQSHAEGRYNGLDRQQLAARLTEDMRAATNDLHMSVNYAPEAQALRQAGPPAKSEDEDPAYLEDARVNNQGVVELRVLPGNIRYLKLNRFFWVPGTTAKAFDRVAEFLREGDAIIIDFSEVPGGSPDSVRYLVSHFMNPGQKLMTYISAVDGETESRTEAVATGRINKPVVFISGQRSASAAEEFAAHVKNFKLGPLIGGKTAGAGNRNDLIPVDDGFVISVSSATARHAVTNEGWEGVGIAPDVATSPALALPTAYVAALEAARKTADAGKVAAIDRILARARVEAKPYPLAIADISALIGKYGPDREVTFQNGALVWRYRAASLTMIPESPDKFVLKDTPVTLKFDIVGRQAVAVTENAQLGSKTIERSKID